MRKKRNQQCSLNFIDAHHEVHEILSGISQWLDAHPQFVDWVTKTFVLKLFKIPVEKHFLPNPCSE